MPIDLLNFVRKWNASSLTERSAASHHFRDLCEVLEVPHPTQSDEIGASYTYEKRVVKAGSGEMGYADVWKRGWFAWEYKSKGGDLKRAYKQLNEYHESLDNPPLLVVCDFVRFEVHTKFENAPPRVFAFSLDDLLVPSDTATCALPPLEVLRHVFGDYNQLRPDIVAVPVTKAAASDFLRLAQRLELEKAAAPERPSKEQIAHFLMRLVFCLFADSVGLLPDHTFRRLVANDRHSPISFNKKLPFLFQSMSERGSFFGPDNIPYFNGGLFSDNRTIELDHADLGILQSASQHDWSHIEPVIFGTLFERSLDQAKRSMIGAHYTSPKDILLLIEPVVMDPLKRRWAQVKESVLNALAEENASGTGANSGAPSSPAALSPPKAGAQGSSGAQTSRRVPQPRLPLHRPALTLLQDWAAELTQVRILDPACGSGNFLYIALKRLLDLWHEARVFGLAHGLTLTLDPIPHPGQLFGIEIDFYAHEIASIVVWIGFLQWKHDHGVKDDKEPLLQKLDNIQHADAILRYNKEDKSPEHPAGKPCEPKWPEAEYIVGNPPFLGGKLLRRELGDTYIDDLFALYKNRVKAESDLVVYWFEKARHQLELQQVARVGLLATQGIRGGANRNVLERIQQTGTIFWAWSDRKWTLGGAAVHVSMIAFERRMPHDHDSDESPNPASEVIPSMAASSDDPRPTSANLPEPAPADLPITIVADLGVTAPTARTIPAQGNALGNAPGSPGGLKARSIAPAVSIPHSAAPCLLDGHTVPFINSDLTTGSNTTSAHRLNENAGICFMGTTKVGPFDIDAETARKMLAAPLNPNGRSNSDVVRPWVNALDITRRPRDMFIIDFGTDTTEQDAALYQLPFEYIRHHVKAFRAEAKSGDATGVPWWRQQRPRPEMRNALQSLKRFISTPSVSKHRIFVYLASNVLPDHAVFAFAREDDYFFGILQSTIHELWARAQGTQLREVESGFRYTPNSTFDTFPFPWPPGTEPSESPRVKAIADAARELVRLRDAWLNPPGTPREELRKRTLTNLYNQRAAGKCAWLADAHRTLDEAVFTAYGWPSTLTTQQILANLLALNHERAAAQPPGNPSSKSKPG